MCFAHCCMPSAFSTVPGTEGILRTTLWMNDEFRRVGRYSGTWWSTFVNEWMDRWMNGWTLWFYLTSLAALFFSRVLSGKGWRLLLWLMFNCIYIFKSTNSDYFAFPIPCQENYHITWLYHHSRVFRPNRETWSLRPWNRIYLCVVHDAIKSPFDDGFYKHTVTWGSLCSWFHTVCSGNHMFTCTRG